MVLLNYLLFIGTSLAIGAIQSTVQSVISTLVMSSVAANLFLYSNIYNVNIEDHQCLNC
jgi:hypothetical protein